MNLDFKSDKKELSQLGILKIYIKAKLKYYYSKNKYKINPQQQTKIIKDWKKIHLINTEAELNKWLKIYGISFEEWINQINSDYYWASWCKEKYDKDLFDYYQSRKNELDLFFYSIIKVKNKELADELYIRVKEEEASFEETAHEFSEGNEKYLKGRLGPAALSSIENSISSLLKIGYTNQLWQPKLINGFWCILRLDKVIHTEFNTNLKLKLALELGEKFLNDEFHQIIENNFF